MKYFLGGNTSTVPSTGSTTYHAMTCSAGGAVAWSTGNTAERHYLLRPLVFSNAIYESVAAPGAGKSYTFTLFDGTTAYLSAALADANTIARSTAGQSKRLESGAFFMLRSVPAGTPGAITNLRWGYLVDTLGDPHMQFFSTYNSPSNSGVTYAPILWAAVTCNASATSNVVAGKMAGSGTIKEIRYDVRDAPGAGKSWTCRIVINGVEQAASEGVISGAASTTATVTGLSIAYTDDDEIVIKYAPSGTPTATFCFQTILALPSKVGCYPVTTSTTSLNNALTNYGRGGSSYASSNTTAETNVKCILPSNIMTYWFNFRTKINADPGGVGKNWVTRLRKNATNLNNSMTVNNGSTTGNDTSSIDAIYGESNVSTTIVPTLLPAAVTTHQFYATVFIPPEVPMLL